MQKILKSIKHLFYQRILKIILILQNIEMIVSDFQPTITSIPSRKNPPQTKTEYAAGFRGYHPEKFTNNPSITTSASQAQDYIAQIGVAGLPQAYHQQLKKNAVDDSWRAVVGQKQSVVRLYRNIYPNRKQNTDEQRKEDKQEREEDKYAQDVWGTDQKYVQEPNSFIIKKQLTKMHNKILAQLNLQIKKQKASPNITFKAVFSAFLLFKHQQLLKPIKKAGARVDADMETLGLWKNCLCHTTLENLISKCKNKTIDVQQLVIIRKNNRYIYTVVKTIVSEGGHQLNYDQIQQLVCEQIDVNPSDIINNFQCQFKYTQPLQVQFVKHQNTKINHLSSEDDDQVQLKKKIKPNPIPKTTYTHPKTQFSKPHSPTKVVPFNISTQKNKPIQFDQFYHWERAFRAQPIPETTYKPQTIKLQSEQQKKARAYMKLSEAHYPQNMKNLQKYKQDKEHQKQQISLKYERHYEKTGVKPIPNFDRTHALELLRFQQISSQNKKQIKVKPFNLSQNRRNGNKQQPTKLQSKQNVRRRPLSSNTHAPPPAKSTLKFQAYKNFRCEEEAKKQEEMDKKMIKEQEEEKKQEKLRKIIKIRMGEELGMQARPQNTFEADKKHKVEIDYEKMYWNRPLLMQSANPHEIKLGWEPIFGAYQE